MEKKVKSGIQIKKIYFSFCVLLLIMIQKMCQIKILNLDIIIHMQPISNLTTDLFRIFELLPFLASSLVKLSKKI